MLVVGAAGFAGAVAIDDSAFAEVVGRDFDVYAIAGKNFDAVAAQPSGDVRQDHVAVVQLDRKGRARKHLFDVAEDFQRLFFDGVIISRSDDAPSFLI